MEINSAVEYLPEDIAILKHAFDTSCHALRFAIDYNPDEQKAAEIRNELARVVIRVYKAGERRPLKIVEQALARMPPLKAMWTV